MLIIRKEQMEVFEQAALRAFQDEMVDHIKEFFPKYYKVHGEPVIRNVISFGVERAHQYGFETKQDIPLFIDLMLLLGGRFDEDVQYSWLREILDDPSISDPVEKANKLYDTASAFLDEAAGQENEYLERGLIRLRDTPYDNFVDSQAAQALPRIEKFLKNIWPQKSKKIEGAAIFSLIQQAIQLARDNNMGCGKGPCLVSIMMFMLGTGFADDPQFPWVTSVLKADTPTDKTDQLYKEAMTFMSKWLP